MQTGSMLKYIHVLQHIVQNPERHHTASSLSISAISITSSRDLRKHGLGLTSRVPTCTKITFCEARRHREYQCRHGIYDGRSLEAIAEKTANMCPVGGQRNITSIPPTSPQGIGSAQATVNFSDALDISNSRSRWIEHCGASLRKLRAPRARCCSDEKRSPHAA